MKKVVFSLIGCSIAMVSYASMNPASNCNVKNLSVVVENDNNYMGRECLSFQQKKRSPSSQKIIIGKWNNKGTILCIYKQRGKYYVGRIDTKTKNIVELYHVVRVSARRYEDRGNGDMPERFDITSNGDMKCYIFDPEAPTGPSWVLWETWIRI